tara:strand:- start:744 stop:1205 length:462 start_codon:yes stop_codon:yes gene_type:complete
MTMGALVKAQAVKLGGRYATPAIKHIQRHWAKYATGGFVADSVFNVTDKESDVKNSDREFTDDDVQFVIGEVDGILEDIQLDNVRMTDKIRRGDAIPHYMLTNIDNGEVTLLERYYGKSFADSMKSSNRRLRGSRNRALNHLNNARNQVIGRD